MDQKLQRQRHKCRLCSKSFLCGRSLGGHMRSHMSSASSVEESKHTNGYGLRDQKPNKTWRLSTSSVSHNEEEEEEKQCKECGKEFHSWRALFGHMRSHSSDKITQEEEGSWSGGEGLVRVPRKKRRPRRPAAIAGPSSSPASEDHEQEDVAISLMMLSRDAGYWGSDTPAAIAIAIESSSTDKNSAILEEEEEDTNRDSDDFKKPKSYYHHDDDVVDELYVENESDDEVSRKGSRGKRKRSTGLDGYGAGLGKSRYECTTCKKSFHSYQALGGHRASHKRLKGRCCGGESSFDTADVTWVDPIAVADSAGAGAGSHYQCGVCGKVFASGQALGGHKRSHLVTSTSPTIVIEAEEEAAVVMPELLDLNLPAPVEEDSSNQRGATAAAAADAEFNSWWRGSNLKNEAMVGMIAN